MDCPVPSITWRERAIEAAAADATPTISAIHVQAALDRLPWLGSSAD
jgi:hypothetical protein